MDSGINISFFHQVTDRIKGCLTFKVGTYDNNTIDLFAKGFYYQVDYSSGLSTLGLTSYEEPGGMGEVLVGGGVGEKGSGG